MTALYKCEHCGRMVKKPVVEGSHRYCSLRCHYQAGGGPGLILCSDRKMRNIKAEERRKEYIRRRAAIVKIRDHGMTYEKIGDLFGITKQAAYMAYKKGVEERV